MDSELKPPNLPATSFYGNVAFFAVTYPGVDVDLSS
jgi:hypothetical protein